MLLRRRGERPLRARVRPASLTSVGDAGAIPGLPVFKRRRLLKSRRCLDVRLVSAEDIAHRAADLAHRGAVLERLSDRRKQVVAAAGGVAQLLEARVDELLVAVRLEG